MPLATVRKRLSELRAAGEVVMCQVTGYEGTKTLEAWQCRASGHVPALAPGGKPKAAQGQGAAPDAAAAPERT